MKAQRKSCFRTNRGDVIFYLSNDLLIKKIISEYLELQPIADIFPHLCNFDKAVHSYLCVVFFSIMRNLS